MNTGEQNSHSLHLQTLVFFLSPHTQAVCYGVSHKPACKLLALGCGCSRSFLAAGILVMINTSARTNCEHWDQLGATNLQKVRTKKTLPYLIPFLLKHIPHLFTKEKWREWKMWALEQHCLLSTPHSPSWITEQTWFGKGCPWEFDCCCNMRVFTEMFQLPNCPSECRHNTAFHVT